MSKKIFVNPFRPGAGHLPPYLAGREHEKEEFRGMLRQDAITSNPIVTGLRGVGKTVLLEELKQIAIQDGWYWVGTDMSESASLSEDRLAIRLLADLAVVSSGIVVHKEQREKMGLRPQREDVEVTLRYEFLHGIFEQTPGLVRDKLQAVLEMVAAFVPREKRGIIFAYDEAQNMADHAETNEFPLSLLLDLFQSIQRKGIRFMLVLVGLPTLFPKLVEARTSAERMFHIIFLDRLQEEGSRAAIVKPIEKNGCPYPLSETLIASIVRESGGYPYFIQFICREVYDVALQKFEKGEPLLVSIPDIVRKLDTDFFAGRWSRATDRQRDLLHVIAAIPNSDTEFTVQEVVQEAQQLKSHGKLAASFSPSHVNQILNKLTAAGFVYKNRHGRYAFAVPLLGQFIRRQAP
jgi:Cdc6-like AAA superfamily ATPase